MTADMPPYCKPNDRSATGTAEICKRVAALLNSLNTHINAAVASGNINTDLERFAQSTRAQLEAEGWTFSYDAGEKLKVRQPGHKHPFPSSRGGTRQEP